jgi:hypothetical protein
MGQHGRSFLISIQQKTMKHLFRAVLIAAVIASSVGAAPALAQTRSN